jgi:predicted nucleic-acid-binding protein
VRNTQRLRRFNAIIFCPKLDLGKAESGLLRIEHLLAADSLEVQNEQQVFEAAFAVKRGTGEFEVALIGALDTWAGCSRTLTFDRKAARLPHFQVIL